MNAKKDTFKFNVTFLTIIVGLLLLTFPMYLNPAGSAPAFSDMEEKIEELMADGDIPGLSIILVKGGGKPIIKNMGFADLERKQPVTSETLFELASCSKAFTGLAVLLLAREGRIRLDDPVSQYLPWFSLTYNGEKCEITLRQLLHHTSGIPRDTLALIPRDNSPNALEKTLQRIKGIELHHLPGSNFEYSSMNYDVLGAVIEKVAEASFEHFMSRRIFAPLGLTHTTVGQKKDHPSMATGYKIGFFSPRRYDSPIFRGNNPAAYVVSNALDMARWLQLQIGFIQTEMSPLFKTSHVPDRSIPPRRNDYSSYAAGWQVVQVGKGELFHSGLNPNFSSYVGLKPGKKLGVAVLANVNSNHSQLIGNYVLKTLAGEAKLGMAMADTNVDKSFSVASLVLGLFLLFLLFFLMTIIYGILTKKRQFNVPLRHGFSLIFLAISLIIPVLVGIYLAPKALANFTWDTVVVWAPISFPIAAILLLAVIATCFLAFLLSAIFPHKSNLFNSMPFVIILSFLTGILNSATVVLIIQSFSGTIPIKYLIFYFCLVLFLYFFVSRVVRKKLVTITNDLVFNLRMRLIRKMFASSYQNFEMLDTGRIYATVNDDTRRIGESPNLIVRTIMNIAIIICIFIYLISISLVSTMVVLGIISVIAAIYTISSRKVQALYENARDTQNVFMGLLDGLVKGFKELSLRFNKRYEYGNDLEETCETFRQKRNLAFFKFIHLNVFFETMLFAVLGFIAIGFPKIFPGIHIYTIISFIMVLFYITGPIAVVIGGIPNLIQVRVSWKRIQRFIREIPASLKLQPAPAEMVGTKQLPVKNLSVEKIEAKDLSFVYQEKDKHERFQVGPIDFEVKKGEILFIIGGNGSGKTTLAKLLTGLYKPDRGEVIVNTNGAAQEKKQLGEFFSAVFSDYHLFAKLYDIDVSQKRREIAEYLHLLELEGKVHLNDGAFSTIDLSGGQRKRLALLQCYLEDCPIYLFDEWAADQDPTFRKFFYRDLLLRMKKDGKIVIAITHDDNYFDVADKIIKMDMGKMEIVRSR